MQKVFTYSVLFHVSAAFVAKPHAKCVSNRPKKNLLQSVACCHPPWEVFDNLQSLKSTFTTVDDLTSQFHINTGSSAWLVDVTNFLNGDIRNSNYPIMLRWPVPIWEKW